MFSPSNLSSQRATSQTAPEMATRTTECDLHSLVNNLANLVSAIKPDLTAELCNRVGRLEKNLEAEVGRLRGLEETVMTLGRLEADVSWIRRYLAHGEEDKVNTRRPNPKQKTTLSHTPISSPPNLPTVIEPEPTSLKKHLIQPAKPLDDQQDDHLSGTHLSRSHSQGSFKLPSPRSLFPPDGKMHPDPYRQHLRLSTMAESASQPESSGSPQQSFLTLPPVNFASSTSPSGSQIVLPQSPASTSTHGSQEQHQSSHRPVHLVSSQQCNASGIPPVIPIYKMSRNITTVRELWIEWTVGINGGPAVRDLERRFHSAWRKNMCERQFFSRRKVIVDEAERLVNSLLPDGSNWGYERAVEHLDWVRESRAGKSKSLNGLSKLLKKEKAERLAREAMERGIVKVHGSSSGDETDHGYDDHDDGNYETGNDSVYVRRRIQEISDDDMENDDHFNKSDRRQRSKAETRTKTATGISSTFPPAVRAISRRRFPTTPASPKNSVIGTNDLGVHSPCNTSSSRWPPLTGHKRKRSSLYQVPENAVPIPESTVRRSFMSSPNTTFARLSLPGIESLSPRSQLLESPRRTSGSLDPGEMVREIARGHKRSLSGTSDGSSPTNDGQFAEAENWKRKACVTEKGKGKERENLRETEKEERIYGAPAREETQLSTKRPRIMAA